MNLHKIDKTLFSTSHCASEDIKWECIINSYDFNRARSVLRHKNIKILNEYLFIKSFRVLATKAQIAELSNMSQVKFISSVSKATALTAVSKKILGVESTLLSGKGIAIAFIDTGLSTHFDFCVGRKRIKYFKDFVEEKALPYDDNGHGTFVAGVCSGNGAMTAGKFSGIAPQADIIALKALNKQGEASADKILDAMEWVYNNHLKYNIRVVCMSFGSEPLGYNDPIMSGAEAL